MEPTAGGGEERGGGLIPGITKIEWCAWQTTEGEWRPGYSSNPLRAVDKETGKRGWWCSHASPGCTACYSEALNKRFGNGLEYIAQNAKRVEFIIDDEEIWRWRRLPAGARLFAVDMADWLHEEVPLDMADRILAGAVLAPHVTLMLLTKRAARLREYLNDPETPERIQAKALDAASRHCGPVLGSRLEAWKEANAPAVLAEWDWPLRNCWIGTSCEDQRRADERIPFLLRTPAAVRFVSAEPLLGPVDLSNWLRYAGCANGGVRCELTGGPACRTGCFPLEWVIAGGESGHGARGCDLEWIRSLIDQCRAAAVPIFVKQVGTKPYFWSAGTGLERHAVALGQKTGKGGDPESWPEELRVRDFPEVGR